MLRVLCPIVAAGAAASPAWRLPEKQLTDGDLAELFDGWKSRYNKSYATSTEEAHRRSVFTDNMRWVVANAPETHGATQFADRTEAEFRTQYLSPLTPAQEVEEAERRAAREVWDGASCETCRRFPEMSQYQEGTAGASLDWSTKGAVTSPKNQGACNNCYAFGASGDMEGAWFMAGNTLTSLSEQMMLDCSGHGSCQSHSGTRSELYKFVIDNGGIVAESTYPYTSGGGRAGTCQPAKETPVVAKFSSYLQISDSKDGEGKIFDAVNKLGPITIGISAVRMEMYGGGIIKGSCNTKHDHAPVVVGYGTDNGVDYWKVKNSWGRGWGEGGYFRIIRGQNMCGMATDALHAVVGGGQRYHCDNGKTCTASEHGHATKAKCVAVCGVPTPPPPPPTPLPPTPPPTPAIIRYHCMKDVYQCLEVPPGGAPGGHPSLDKCESECYAPGYLCNTTTQHCYGVATGGAKLHTCQETCTGGPTPIPMYTPPPTLPPTPVPDDICQFSGCSACGTFCQGHGGYSCRSGSGGFTCTCSDGKSCHD